ncbi:conserved domain protein [Hyphomonas neptunium ATCC 15444]|uniref:Conserved domain protein n=2 Tax=Hyphomonas TaxID=85 RepID=Q0BX20_HYPNA|nr:MULTISPECIES: hypothetical protein [Hyphomonas]ABI77028.1 conserved domain protein [Hyphomonas neptunium ATCC 15444]KCZ92027.1 hypothetical protein HHI_12379 [Hyphomonas hirschiana VP5]
MGILLRILGVIWILAGLLATVVAVFGAMAESAADTSSAVYAIGAFIGAGLVLTPVWLTGIAFFLLPGWVRKQLATRQTDIFA